MRTIDVQGADGHGAVPSTHAVRVDTNVADTGTNPAGTGPPSAPESAVVVVAVVGAADDGEGAEDDLGPVTDVGVAPGLDVDVHAVTANGASTSTTTSEAARDACTLLPTGRGRW